MPQVLLLTSTPTPLPDETAAQVPEAFREHGWHIETACIDTLGLGPGGATVTGPQGSFDLSSFDLLWVLGFGRAETFLDKMQLLSRVPESVKFVNTTKALLLWHAKYPAADITANFPQPETYAASDATTLIRIATAQGGRWVLKPPAGSFGRGVTIAHAGSTALAEAARHLTQGRRYALLQRWCPEVRLGEHRVLVAGDRIIGTYARAPATADKPANLRASGQPRLAQSDPARDALALGAAQALARRGVRFAGLDIAGPWILEANVINPGGVATLASLGDRGVAHRLVSALLASLPR